VCMGRLQVYLPDELQGELRARGLSASKLLQDALHREIRQAELDKAVDRYLKRLDTELGPATEAEKAEAEEWAERVSRTRKPSARRRRAS
jgi:hypothetical protein